MWITVPYPDDITAEPIYEGDSADAINYLISGHQYDAVTQDGRSAVLHVDLTSWLVFPS